MSFNVDDPLAGILSDGSDDSFFDDDILGKKKPANKKSATVEKKSTLFDLENINKTDKSKDIIANDKIQNAEASTKIAKKTGDSETIKSDNHQLLLSASSKFSANDGKKNKEQAHSNDLLLNELTDTKNLSTPFKHTAGANNEKLDIIEDFMGPKKESLERGKGSQSLLDDILGKSSKKFTQVAKSATTKSQPYNVDNVLGRKESKETLASKKQLTMNSTTSVHENKPKSSGDWLGIFENKNEDLENENTDMPPWLGGTNSMKKIPLEKGNNIQIQKDIQPVMLHPPTSSTQPTDIEFTDKNKEEHNEFTLAQDFEKPQNLISTTPNLQKTDEDIVTQGAVLYMQQQEAQLMVALQLKAQDEKLATMQMKQKETQRVQREATLAQQAQLDAMLQKQVNNRLQMQAIINAHQDRISKRIKALLETNDTEQEDKNGGDESESIVKDNKESPKSGNQEKSQLLQLIQSLQENHDKEIDLMESSYRRQLAFLEMSINQTEERMKEESDKVVRFHMEKINWLEDHHQLYKKWTEENTTSLITRHNVEKEMLRQQHLENVKVLQEHHAALMENIKNAVKQEQVIIRDSAGFSSDIQELLTDVKDYKLKCIQLVEKVSTLTNKTEHETEKSLHIREAQINDMIQQLKKERVYFENEKTESKDMIKMLEVRLKQMTSMIEEESASLKQKKMEFEFEKATFSKQTEFAKNVLKKQDEELKMLKDDLQKEYQEKITKINEEKAAALKDSAFVAKEKVSIQSLKMDLEKTKVELQAQLEELHEERLKINQEKQELHMEEQRLLAKSKDIEILTKTAVEKQSLADRKFAEAESQQRKYEERIRRLQEHVVSLNTREKQIAREKIALSRERISLHNDWKQMEGRQQCSLCRSIPRAPQYNLDAVYPQSYDFPASRDYGEVNMGQALSTIEQEMAHLMGRTFGLRHDAVLSAASEAGDQVKANELGVGGNSDNVPAEGSFKDYMDPKFMMLRLDVQKVIHSIEDKGSTTNNK